MHKAEMLPLGDPMARYQFAAGLEAAGLNDVADQQRDFALRTGGSYDDIGFCEVYNLRKDTAIDRRQWHDAADDLDRLCLMSLSNEVEWNPPSRMLVIAADAHLMKAREARDHRDFASMDRELQLYQQYLPASADMVLEMVPALDAIGDHARADALFNGVYQKLNELCRKYPKSVTYLNQTAWMCACCDRQLDQAQKAAETDVRLQPNNWQVLDTLAEVRFRRGDRSGALALEKQAQTMTSDPYTAKQVKRFETAEIPPVTNPGIAPE
jgi:tetratricopeptide (TPR) repeat protein